MRVGGPAPPSTGGPRCARPPGTGSSVSAPEAGAGPRPETGARANSGSNSDSNSASGSETSPGTSPGTEQDGRPGYCGQAASMSAAVFWIDCPSANQAVSDFHSCPAPTAAGIRSEPSKRKVADGSVSASADSLSIGSV